MKKHYLEDQFLNAFIGQIMRSVFMIAAVAGLIVTGLSVDTTDLSTLDDVLTLLETRQ